MLNTRSQAPSNFDNDFAVIFDWARITKKNVLGFNRSTEIVNRFGTCLLDLDLEKAGIIWVEEKDWRKVFSYLILFYEYGWDKYRRQTVSLALGNKRVERKRGLKSVKASDFMNEFTTALHDASDETSPAHLNKLYVGDVNRGTSSTFIYEQYKEQEAGYIKPLTTEVPSIVKQSKEKFLKYYNNMKAVNGFADLHSLHLKKIEETQIYSIEKRGSTASGMPFNVTTKYKDPFKIPISMFDVLGVNSVDEFKTKIWNRLGRNELPFQFIKSTKLYTVMDFTRKGCHTYQNDPKSGYNPTFVLEFMRLAYGKLDNIPDVKFSSIGDNIKSVDDQHYRDNDSLSKVRVVSGVDDRTKVGQSRMIQQIVKHHQDSKNPFGCGLLPTGSKFAAINKFLEGMRGKIGNDKLIYHAGIDATAHDQHTPTGLKILCNMMGQEQFVKKDSDYFQNAMVNEFDGIVAYSDPDALYSIRDKFKNDIPGLTDDNYDEMKEMLFKKNGHLSDLARELTDEVTISGVFFSDSTKSGEPPTIEYGSNFGQGIGQTYVDEHPCKSCNFTFEYIYGSQIMGETINVIEIGDDLSVRVCEHFDPDHFSTGAYDKYGYIVNASKTTVGEFVHGLQLYAEYNDNTCFINKHDQVIPYISAARSSVSMLFAEHTDRNPRYLSALANLVRLNNSFYDKQGFMPLFTLVAKYDKIINELLYGKLTIENLFKQAGSEAKRMTRGFGDQYAAILSAIGQSYTVVSLSEISAEEYLTSMPVIVMVSRIRGGSQPKNSGDSVVNDVLGLRLEEGDTHTHAVANA